MLQGEHNACQVEGTVQPTQAATRTWVFGGGQDSAAYRDGGYRVNIAVDEDRLGSWRRRLMDL